MKRTKTLQLPKRHSQKQPATMQNKIWLKRVLIPLWVIMMIWSVAVLVISSLDFYVVNQYETQYSNSDTQQVYQAIDIAAAILIAFAAITIVFAVAEIILFARHRLGPVTYLVMSVFTWIFWTLIFVLDINGAAQGAEQGLAFLWSTPLFLASTAQLVYGSVIVHRKRTGKLAYRGDYTQAEQGPAGQPLYRGYESPPRGSYAGYNPNNAAPNPFRDPSPGPSVAPVPDQTKTHPAFRESGQTESYYNNQPEAAHNSYEMQSTGYRDA